jgi:hypothetical protein
MPGTTSATIGRQRDVHGLLHEDPRLVLLLEDDHPGRQGLVDGTAGLADAGARLLACLRGQRTDLAVRQGERRSVAGVIEADLLQLVEVARRCDGAQGVLAHPFDLGSLQRGDLDGVVVSVGAGHGSLSSRLDVDGAILDWVGRGLLPGPGDVSEHVSVSQIDAHPDTVRVRGAEIADWGSRTSL